MLILDTKITTEEQFKREYMQEFICDESEPQVRYCGECKFYSNGCTTSYLENKHGCSSTPACSEFEEG